MDATTTVLQSQIEKRPPAEVSAERGPIRQQDHRIREEGVRGFSWSHLQIHLAVAHQCTLGLV